MPYSAADVRLRETIARILICALPKAGKTTCAVLTAPKPVFVLNTDGRGALDPVVLLGGEFEAEDVTDIPSYDRALAYFKTNINRFYDPARGIRGTLIFDNMSTFAGKVMDDLKKEFKDGRQLFPELQGKLVKVMRDLIVQPTHVIVLGHLKQGERVNGESSKMLGVPGGGGTAIASLVQDWLGLDVSIDPTTNEVKREFLLAPEGAWSAAARSVKNIKRMPADVTRFLELVRQQRTIVEEAPVEVEEEQLQAEAEQPVEQVEQQAAAAGRVVPTVKPTRTPVRAPVRVANGQRPR
jgi:hypothetical protein